MEAYVFFSLKPSPTQGEWVYKVHLLRAFWTQETLFKFHFGKLFSRFSDGKKIEKKEEKEKRKERKKKRKKREKKRKEKRKERKKC